MGIKLSAATKPVNHTLVGIFTKDNNLSSGRIQSGSPREPENQKRKLRSKMLPDRIAGYAMHELAEQECYGPEGGVFKIFV